jgi:cyanophycin synthetase
MAMDYASVKAYRGPNIWGSELLIEAELDLNDQSEVMSHKLAGFADRLLAWLPGLANRPGLPNSAKAFAAKLREGVHVAEAVERVAVELQSLAGTELFCSQTVAGDAPGITRILFQYSEERVGKAVAWSALEVVNAAIRGGEQNIESVVVKLQELNYDTSLGPSTRSIVEAAAALGVPFKRMSEGSLVRLGWGAKQRRILTAETDQTPAVAEYIAQNKELTRELLSAVGVPTPLGRPVKDAEDAWAAAQEIGVPVVVKPQYGNHGRGVTTNLWTKADVLAAYEDALPETSTRSILVERYAVGADHRLLVVGDRLVAAAYREPPCVIGDGRRTIRQLVEIINRDPRRSDDHATVLTRIRLCEIAEAVVAAQGFTFDSIPPEGVKVLIRNNANLSVGGTAADVTDRVHPLVAARAVEAAQMIGLDIAGIDVIAQDISRPLEEQGGVILEVNAGPGLRMHLGPSSGKPQPVGEAIASMLFPNGENGRIPLVATTGVNGKTTTTRFIAHILRRSGKRVGYTCTDGIYLDQRRIATGDCSGPASAQMILSNPAVEAAVLETARGGILRAGLGYDRADVAVVTNIGEGDHLGLGGVETLEQLAEVKRVLIENVASTGYGVLKADDPLTVAMADHCPGEIIYFCQDAEHPVVVSHREAGGRAVIVRQATIMLAEGDVEIPLASLAKVPLTHGGRIGFQIENALASAAAAWGLGISRDVIRTGLETFGCDLEQSPGRFNLLEVGGATVIVDYGHNPSALEALIDAIEQFPPSRRTVVYTAAGDRRDCDMIRQGEQLGDAFDRVILYEDHYVRGRSEGEIMALIRQGLESGNRVADITQIKGAIKAVEASLRDVLPGDLLLVQADEVDETIDFIRRYLAADPSSREIVLADALRAHAATETAGSLVD